VIHRRHTPTHASTRSANNYRAPNAAASVDVFSPYPYVVCFIAAFGPLRVPLSACLPACRRARPPACPARLV